jgi:hypothetical protein
MRFLEGGNRIKGAKGTKVKVIFQGWHMTHVIYLLVYNLVFSILDTQFNITC